MAVMNMLPGRAQKVRYTPFEMRLLSSVIGMPPNNVFFVSSGAAVSSNVATAGTYDLPFATLAYAITQCTASKGDVIVLMPGHAETTTAVAWSKAGTKILGLGYGRNRPTLTATTAATDLINLTAANCELENVRLVGAASGVTALLDLSSAATDFVCRGCSFEMAATPLEGITLNAGRFLFEDCDFLGTANGPDRCFSIETKIHDWRIINCRAMFGTSGLDNEFIKSVKACTDYYIADCVLIGMDTLVVNFASSSAGAPDGLWDGGSVMYSAAVTSVEDGVAAATSKGLAFARPLWGVDVTGKSGGKIPLTTAS